MKHYHIKQDADNFYKISERHRFPTIQELIEYHKLNSGGKFSRKLRHRTTMLRHSLCLTHALVDV